MVSCCCYIPEEKDMSTVLPVVSLSQSCVRCLSTIEDIRPPRCQEARDVAETKVQREFAREKEREAELQIARGS